MPAAKSFGSYPGRLVNASTSPVRGSITTAAPLKPPALKPSSAARCRSMSIVSCTRRPSLGGNFLERIDFAPHAVDARRAARRPRPSAACCRSSRRRPARRWRRSAGRRSRPALRSLRRRSRTGARQTNRRVLPRRHFLDQHVGQLRLERRASTAATCASEASSTTTIGR